MNIVISCAIFLVGVLLVIYGGDRFVDAACWMARAAKVPSFIIGATIVSIATTLPEMIVSLPASLEGKNDMAVGNAVGSVTANTGLIMALAILFMTVVAPRKQFIKQFVILVAAACILWAGSMGGTVALWAALALIALFLIFMTFNVRDAKRSQGEEAQPVEVTRKSVVTNLLLFAFGAAAIVLGSNLLIRGGSDIATALGVPERVIAVTMVAIGTSLPELVTTLTAIRKKESHMSIGNIVGANIIDLSLILPLCYFVSGGTFTVSPQCLALDFPACLIVVLMAVVPLVIFQKGHKLQGALMLAAYGVYLFLTV